LHFDIDDQRAFNLPRESSDRIVVRATVFVERPMTVTCGYDAHEPTQGMGGRSVEWKRLDRTGQWVDLQWELSGAKLANGLHAGADFALILYSLPVREVTVTRIRAKPSAQENFALQFDGKTSRVEIPSWHYDGKSPLTIECFVTPHKVLRDNLSHVQILLAEGYRQGASLGMRGNGQFEFYLGGDPCVHCAIPADEQRAIHLAAVCDGRNLSLYVDGTRTAVRPLTLPVQFSTLPLLIGANPHADKTTSHFEGVMDEVRISSTARYTDSFVMPRPHERFAPDDHTIALYHCDEERGEVLTDSSGHRHHGKIIGARFIAQSAPAEFTNALGMQFVRVPAGKSWLGGGGGKPGSRAVEFEDDFYLGRYEVTQGEWLSVMVENPSQFSRSGSGKGNVAQLSDDELLRLPVDGVSWDDCRAFLKKLNDQARESGWQYRLPTADEWEYACRGGPLAALPDSAFHYYLERPTDKLETQNANFAKDRNRPTTVGSYKPNRLGLFDMHGNVREWCDDPPDAQGRRTSVGGSWTSTIDAGDCRASARGKDAPTWKHYQFGLRLVRCRAATSAAAYLDDLNEASYVGFGPLHKPGKGPELDGEVEREFGGEALSHALMVHPVENPSPEKLQAVLSYDLGGRFAEFQTTVKCRSDRDKPLYVGILGDDRVLVVSDDLMSHKTSGVPLTANVTGVRKLTILVTAQTHKDRGHVLLLAPRLAASSFTNSLGMEFMRIPAGKSWLGGGGGKPGTSDVAFNEDFYLGKYEVTQAQWRKLMGNNPSHFQRTGGGNDLVTGFTDAELQQFPVDNVTWDECQEFIRRLNEQAADTGWVYRLPTVAEWEYACRGGPLTDPAESAFDFYVDKPTSALFPELTNAGVDHKKLMNRTCQVGSYSPNRLGLFDMHGNVWERCADRLTNDNGVQLRPVKGGGWNSQAALCKAAHQSLYPPSVRHEVSCFGFRVARVPVAGTWQSLFDGKNPAALTFTNPRHDGKGEVVMEDGQSVLQLQPRFGIDSPHKTGDFHLRFDYKVGTKAKGGINLHEDPGIGVQLRLDALGRATPTLPFHIWGATCQEAELTGGKFVPIGKTVGKDAYIDFMKFTLDPSTPWQRIDALRLGDSLLFVVNGQFAGAITNLRDARQTAEQPAGYSPVIFWTDGGTAPAQFHNISIREINALPPEIVELAAWQPLFNGRDLTGWARSNTTDKGTASVVTEDGQPALRLVGPITLAGPKLRDHHLRYQFKPDLSSAGSITYYLPDNSSLLLSRGANWELGCYGGAESFTYQQATWDGQRLVASGAATRERLQLAAARPARSGHWQTMDVLRVADEFAYFVDGEFVGAIVGLSQSDAPFRDEMQLRLGASQTLLVRDLEVRTIESLAAESVSLVAWRPLLNGRDLTGWRGDRSGWKVENGELVGTRGGLRLWYDEAPPDFELACEVRGENDSFLVVRDGGKVEQRAILGIVRPGDIWQDIGDWKHVAHASTASSRGTKSGEFNDVLVCVVGQRITVTVNGVVACDKEIPIAASGSLSWMTGGDAKELRIRNLRLREIAGER
jgi:formylglycine-generating enzyme required for sulfatase activity